MESFLFGLWQKKMTDFGSSAARPQIGGWARAFEGFLEALLPVCHCRVFQKRALASAPCLKGVLIVSRNLPKSHKDS